MTATEAETIAFTGATPDELPVCDEYPVSLDLNDQRVVTLLCTPRDLSELAVGWLYCEGLIDGVDELAAVGACDELSRVRVFTDTNRPLVQSEWRRVITSGCGSGHAIDPTELATLPQVTSDFSFPPPPPRSADARDRARWADQAGGRRRPLGGTDR